MDGFVTQFLNHLRIQRRASAHTIRSYEHDLALYRQYVCEVKGDDADPSAVDSAGPARRSRHG